MDNGARFVLDNFEKSINICENNNEYRFLLKKIKRHYDVIKHIYLTGNMYDYFLRYENGHHRDAEQFKKLHEFGVFANEDICEYLRNNYKSELDRKISYLDLQINDIVTQQDIFILFGGSRRGACIRKITEKKVFLLVLNDTYNSFYNDDNIIEFNYGPHPKDASKCLIRYKEFDYKIYVFRRIGRNQYKFFGECEIVDHSLDENGTRKIILNRINNFKKITHFDDSLAYLTFEESKDAYLLPEPTAYELKCSRKKSYKRDQKVSAFTKHRAHGKCDLCGRNAPFKNKFGQPYLECHHIIYLANGGPDRIYNTVALCPNCHKKIHAVGSAQDKKSLLVKVKKYLEDSSDQDNLIYFKKLFWK